MNFKKYLPVILFLACLAPVFGQQDPNYTFYRYSMNLFNPAFAGSAEGPEVVLGLRSQWAGVEGAPESQSAIFSTPIGQNVGLGLSVLNDRTFIENQTWVAIDFSYKLQLNENTNLFFGLKASGNNYDVNTQGLITYGVGQDGSLMDFKSRFTPNIGVGVYVKGDNYFLSLSAPKLLSPERLQERDGQVLVGMDRRHVYLVGAYDFVLGKGVTLQTTSMLRYVDAAPLSVDLTTVVDFGNHFKLGATYRYNEAFGGLVLFEVSNSFSVGYAYEWALQQELSNIDNNSHELFMRLRI